MGEDRLLSNVTYSNVADFRHHLEQTVTHNQSFHLKTSINRKLSAISQMFRLAVHKGLIRKHPLTDKESLRFKEGLNRHRWLAEEEIRILVGRMP